ncbi:MAG: glycine cleavage system protein GcvH [Micromonosporaceae bacterium]|nr:glycine cleavage system protein GcvH [Micromonosporaceae bacterium]
MVPEQLRYTAGHEWVATGDDGRVRVGITHYAQEALGDIVFLQLPEVGTVVAAGDVLGEVESTKSVSEIYAPVAGTVATVNDAAVDAPERVNADPYGAGWLLEIELLETGPAGPDALDGLLDAAGYRKLTDA